MVCVRICGAVVKSRASFADWMMLSEDELSKAAEEEEEEEGTPSSGAAPDQASQ